MIFQVFHENGHYRKLAEFWENGENHMYMVKIQEFTLVFIVVNFLVRGNFRLKTTILKFLGILLPVIWSFRPGTDVTKVLEKIIRGARTRNTTVG